jgi:hypothetical protein
MKVVYFLVQEEKEAKKIDQVEDLRFNPNLQFW